MENNSDAMRLIKKVFLHDRKTNKRFRLNGDLRPWMTSPTSTVGKSLAV